MAAQSVIETPGDPARLRLLGGALSIDFVNTIDPRHARERVEYLPGYEELLTWASHAGVPVRSAGYASISERSARALHREALMLRDALYELFARVAQGVRPPDSAVALLERYRAEAERSRRLAYESVPWQLEFAEPVVPAAILWTVALDAVRLLTSPSVSRIRECPGLDGCGWLFVDDSRGGNRRWCSMDVCGNRAKASRHYRRSLERRKAR